MEKKIRNRVKEREETVKKQQFGSAREGTRMYQRPHPHPKAWPSLWTEGSPKLGESGLVCGAEQPGRTDGRTLHTNRSHDFFRLV